MASQTQTGSPWISGFGAATCTLLYAAPLYTMRKIFKNKSVQGCSFPLFPVTLLNCIVWVFYGSTQGSWAVAGVNGLGALFQVFFIVFYLWFTAGSVLWIGVAEVLVSLGAGCVVAGLGFGGVGAAGTVFGWTGAVTTGLMYFGPAQDVYEALRTQSSKPLSIIIIGASLANSILWTAYGFMPKDLFIAIPNIIGVGAALVQLAIYVCFYDNAPADDDDDDDDEL